MPRLLSGTLAGGVLLDEKSRGGRDRTDASECGKQNSPFSHLSLSSSAPLSLPASDDKGAHSVALDSSDRHVTWSVVARLGSSADHSFQLDLSTPVIRELQRSLPDFTTTPGGHFFLLFDFRRHLSVCVCVRLLAGESPFLVLLMNWSLRAKSWPASAASLTE